MSGAPAMPHLEHFETCARVLLEAYATGAPEAMERHYALTWHRRPWKTMREYVQLELGKRPARSGEDVPLTIDDARTHVALEHGFDSWGALHAEVSRWPARALMASSPVRVRSRAGDEGRVILRTRDWDDALAALAENPGATLDGNGEVTDDVLERLARIEHLETLHLGGSKRVTDRGVLALARLPRLHDLDLSGTGVTDEGLRVLRDLASLRRVSLVMTRVTDAGLAHLTACRDLQRLDLMWTRTGDGAIRALNGLESLTHFTSGNDVTDAGLAALHGIPAYVRPRAAAGGAAVPNELVLRGPYTNAGMHHLRGLDGLTTLALHDNRLTAAAAARLAELPALESLACDPDDAWMPHLAALPALRDLSAQDTVAGDDGFEALSRSRTLERFWGRRCYNLRDRGFLALSRMPALRDLAASCRNVSDAALAALPEFPALRALMPMDVPDAGYRHVGRCSELEALTLMYCRDTTDAATEQIVGLTKLRRYFNSYTTITDRTPALLGTMTSLEEITFSACHALTDDGVARLAALPRLRRLEVSGRGVTPALAARFPESVVVRVES